MKYIYKLIDWIKSKLKGKPKDMPFGDPPPDGSGGDHPPPPPPRK